MRISTFTILLYLLPLLYNFFTNKVETRVDSINSSSSNYCTTVSIRYLSFVWLRSAICLLFANGMPTTTFSSQNPKHKVILPYIRTDKSSKKSSNHKTLLPSGLTNSHQGIKNTLQFLILRQTNGLIFNQSYFLYRRTDRFSINHTPSTVQTYGLIFNQSYSTDVRTDFGFLRRLSNNNKKKYLYIPKLTRVSMDFISTRNDIVKVWYCREWTGW